MEVQHQHESHTLRSHGVTVARTHMHDWLILMLLVAIYVILSLIHPFHRFVGKDMMDDLKYPLKDNTVPSWAIPVRYYSPLLCTQHYNDMAMSVEPVTHSLMLSCWIRYMQFCCLWPSSSSFISVGGMSMIFIMLY